MRISLSILALFVGLFAPFWVFCLFAVVYAFVYTAYDLILYAALIDAQFGIGISSFEYVYTVWMGVIVVVVELLKPNLSFLRQEHDL